MSEPDTRVATMDRYITATQAVLATEIAAATVMVGCPGYGANQSAVCSTTVRVSEDRRTSTAAALLIGSAASQKTSS
jgi:hypothetical protein